MEVDGQLHAPAVLTRTKISLFTLGNMSVGPCQDPTCDCWIGERRRLRFLWACVIYIVEDGGEMKIYVVSCFNKLSVNYSRVETIELLLHW